MTAGDPWLRGAPVAAVRGLSAEALRVALVEALETHAGRSDPERLLAIGLKLATAQQADSAALGLDWAEGRADEAALRPLAYLLQGLWDPFGPQPALRAQDVARAVALRARRPPSLEVDLPLLLAFAAAGADPAARPLVAGPLGAALDGWEEGEARRLLAATVATHLAR